LAERDQPPEESDKDFLNRVLHRKPEMAFEKKPVSPIGYDDTEKCFTRGLFLGNQVAQMLNVLDAREAQLKAIDLKEGFSYITRGNTSYYRNELEADQKKLEDTIDKAFEDVIPNMVDRFVKTADDSTTRFCLGFDDTVEVDRFQERIDKVKQLNETRNYGPDFRRAVEHLLDDGEI
jgi:hypothetical protein